MSVEHRHAHRGRRDAQIRQIKNLSGLIDHLLFFFCVAGIEEYIDLRQDVPCDRVGELLGGFALKPVFQIAVSAHARAGDCLVGRIDHALESVFHGEGLECHHRLNG
ncbi:hypothetical protein SDC9_92903 [bioreactor metagenome]|uniref:Uncharacterized protein n=1 Tax=bioreactor metagenome TaxID=1076179 RepID=A0A644ZZ27_9ZZZZ